VVACFLTSGKSVAEIARERSLDESIVRQWIRQAAADAAPPATVGDGPGAGDAASSAADDLYEMVSHWSPDDADEPAGRGSVEDATGDLYEMITHWSPEENAAEAAGSSSDGAFPCDEGVESADYQAQVVAWFVATGKPIAEVASELNLSEATVREWVRRAADEVAPVPAIPPAAPPLEPQPEPVTPTRARRSRSAGRRATARPSGTRTRPQVQASPRTPAETEAAPPTAADATVETPTPEPVRGQGVEDEAAAWAALVEKTYPSSRPTLVRDPATNGNQVDGDETPSGRPANPEPADAAETNPDERRRTRSHWLRRRDVAAETEGTVLRLGDAEPGLEDREPDAAVVDAVESSPAGADIGRMAQFVMDEIGAAERAVAAADAAEMLEEERAAAERAAAEAAERAAAEAAERAAAEAAERVAAERAAREAAERAAAAECAAAEAAERVAAAECAAAEAAERIAAEGAAREAAERVAAAECAAAEAAERIAAEGAAREAAERAAAERAAEEQAGLEAAELAAEQAGAEAAVDEGGFVADAETAEVIGAPEAGSADASDLEAGEDSVEPLAQDSVEASGRTESEARRAALELLGVDDADAHVEVIRSEGHGLWRRVLVRAEVTTAAPAFALHPPAVVPAMDAEASNGASEESEQLMEVPGDVDDAAGSGHGDSDDTTEAVDSVWVEGSGRTEAEARRAALDLLGVDDADAEVEVVPSESSRLRRRVLVRARIRSVGQ
jgi:hypothetical protein